MSVFKMMDQSGIYTIEGQLTNEDILEKAADILLERVLNTDVISDPTQTRRFLQMKLAPHDYEVFAVMFLNNRHQVIAFKELFRGTIDGSSVYPREVLKEALAFNAAAIVTASAGKLQ